MKCENTRHSQYTDDLEEAFLETKFDSFLVVICGTILLPTVWAMASSHAC